MPRQQSTPETRGVRLLKVGECVVLELTPARAHRGPQLVRDRRQ